MLANHKTILGDLEQKLMTQLSTKDQKKHLMTKLFTDKILDFLLNFFEKLSEIHENFAVKQPKQENKWEMIPLIFTSQRGTKQ